MSQTPSTRGKKQNTQTREDTQEPTPSAITNQNLNFQTLQSGTILSRRDTVDLEEYLKILQEKAESENNITVTQCDYLDRALRNRSDQFKREQAAFSATAQGENEEQQTEDNSPVGNTSGDLILYWKSPQLGEDSPSHSRYNLRKMAVDYAKVAKLTSQLVPIFAGGQGPNVSNELQTFLGCSKKVMECLTQDVIPAFLNIFPTRLHGEAYQLVASNLITTFAEVDGILNRTYLPREAYQEMVNRLITSRQNPLEALITFATRINHMLRLCKEAAATKYGAKTAPAVHAQLEDFAKNAHKSGVTNPLISSFLY